MNILVKKTHISRIYLAILSICISASWCMASEQDSLLSIMRDELNREMSGLKNLTPAPFYMDYSINDIERVTIKTSFGSLVESSTDKIRMLRTQVKVGSYDFDNNHPLPDENYMRYQSMGGIPSIIPFENSADAIRVSLWESTQANYLLARELYKHIKSKIGIDPADQNDIPDFSKEAPSVYYEAPPLPVQKIFDKTLWENRLKKYSELFLVKKQILTADVSLVFNSERKYFISTEGSSVVQNGRYAQLIIDCSEKTADGEIIPLIKTYFAFTPDGMPSDSTLYADIHDLIGKVEKMEKAPLAEPYSGPAILNAKAAGVFFHEIFGHRIEGHRLKDDSDGQTFVDKLDQQILPKSISVIFDPTITEYDGNPLNGSYHYDDEGIKGTRFNAVENGVFKNFLMSRTPVKGFLNSNGHGRSAPGLSAVSRQSNLIVKNSAPESNQSLKKMLLKECRKQHKEYGYLFADVVGGVTLTDRFSPNAFNIFPIEVYKVYVDGRPDELVRGVDLVGTPLSMFAEIEAAGDNPEIFNGICGAESGGIPVSAVSPSLFVRRIETQKKPETKIKSTILSRPALNEN